jgi:hypothetical protein
MCASWKIDMNRSDENEAPMLESEPGLISTAPEDQPLTLAGFCEQEGVTLPALPEWAEAKPASRGEALFSTRELPAAPYDMDAYLEAWRAKSGPDPYLIVGIDGYGVQSWFFHYYLVEGPLAIFFQPSWPSVLTDASAARDRINGLVEYADEIRQLAREAVAAGKFPEGKRLVVIESDKGDARWAWAPDEVVAEAAVDWQEEPFAAFAVKIALEDLMVA